MASIIELPAAWSMHLSARLILLGGQNARIQSACLAGRMFHTFGVDPESTAGSQSSRIDLGEPGNCSPKNTESRHGRMGSSRKNVASAIHSHSPIGPKAVVRI